MSLSNETEVLSDAQKSTDFVWAVRLAKISKGLFDRKWWPETVSDGATFGLDIEADEGQQVVDALQAEGLRVADVTNVKKMKAKDEVFVIGADDTGAGSTVV